MRIIFPDSAQTVYTVKIPDPSTEEVIILNGGDLGWNHESVEMNELIRSQDVEPDLILIGGDISYDNNMDTCYSTYNFVMWDLPYNWTQEDGSTRLVPLIFAAGNHDLGTNSNP